jgi:flagellar hook protein FlgE
MLGSLYTSISGLKGYLTSLNIAGNNISNVNSIGFKGGRATFRETLVQTLRSAAGPQGNLGGRSPVQLGLGMGVGSIDNILTQGVLQNTGIATDLGINGEGFFVLSDGRREYYTRAGAFGYDANGNLVNPANGMIVQGRLADDNGVIAADSPIANLVLPFGRKVPARATDIASFACNLNSTATTSAAALETAGTTGITSVLGNATSGAGGSHVVTITGLNATASSLAGTNLTSPAALTGSETLESLGVTDFSDFTISVDGGTEIAIAGLTGTSTVMDLVSAINSNCSGVTASLSGGEVLLSRDYAGDGAIYNITTSLGVDGNISRQIFGAGSGSAFTVNTGTASTLVATDVFTPTGRAAMDPVTLALVTDPHTGLVTGISDLGGGGVTVRANAGLAEGTAIIDTAATEHYASMVVYDSQGAAHNMSVCFSRGPVENQWYWRASFDGAEAIESGGSGTITFNPDGSLASFAADDASTTLVVNPGNGAETMSMTMDMGPSTSFDGMTQFASPFSATGKSQNGYTMGTLTSLAVGSDGTITGFFSNGTTKTIAQVVLAKFTNPAGLEKVGDSLYVVSSNSGAAVKGEPGSIVNATLSAGTLEMSNVDLAEEFVGMIVAQRGFQANARVLNASDQMLTELVNLTR